MDRQHQRVKNPEVGETRDMPENPFKKSGDERKRDGEDEEESRKRTGSGNKER
jgi:hypothetical protein